MYRILYVNILVPFQVNLVFGDMRTWEAPVKADVMVSELLGSFGCNELSPECLDGAQEYLAEGGICIPQKYTNYLQPVATSKASEGRPITCSPSRPPRRAIQGLLL